MPPPHLQSSPQEDISAVMGRFHAWDAGRKAPPSSAPGEGLRELSYEEALALNNTRRPARQSVASLPPVVPAVVADDIPAESADAPMQSRSLRERPAARGRNAQPLARAAATWHEVKKGGEKSARLASASAPSKSASPDAVRARAIETKAVTTSKPLPKSATPKPKKTSASAKAAVTEAGRPHPLATAAGALDKLARKAVKAAAPAEARQSMTFRGTLAACMVEAPRSAARSKLASGRKRPAGKVAVPEAMQSAAMQRHRSKSNRDGNLGSDKKAMSTVGPVKTIASRKPVESIARTISVNLRLSQPEHDRMRRGAEEADLTLAAFIRESTLRYQVARQREKQAGQDARTNLSAQTFQAMHHEDDIDDGMDDEAFDRSIVEPSGPSLLTRMKNFWLGRRLTAIA